MKGKFIVIEGIDGCGKTTQIDELSKWLPNSGLIKKGIDFFVQEKIIFFNFNHLLLEKLFSKVSLI